MPEVLRLIALFALLVAGPAGRQAPSPLPLGEVQITGTRRFAAADVTRLSGLKLGQPVTGAEFDAAAKEMASTGLFRRVAFRYVSNNGKWILTFDLEDQDWNMSVVFDNFIWFSDDDLTTAVREAVPTFAGQIPPTPEATARITGVLQRLLQAKSLPGRVEVLPEGDLRAMKGYVFKIVDPSPLVCSWAFNGASAIPARDLEAELTAAGRTYSRTFVARASKGTLLDLYRRLGFWRAAIADPVASLAGPGACAGVVVAISISEGARYEWSGAEWRGNTAIPSSDLDRILGMKNGDAAGLRLLEDGFRRVNEAYGQQGYITERATYEPRLDDAAHRAVFAINVQEGLQYLMGAVDFPGLAPADAASLAKRWRLKAGDVYDASYPGRFLREEVSPRLPRGSKPPQIQARADPQRRAVDVRFVFSQ